MVIANENKAEKRVNIYFITDDMDTVCQSDLYQKEVRRLGDAGYTINSFIFPNYNEMPDNVQELYNKAYYDKAIMDSFVSNGADAVLWDSICQVIKQRISKFSKEDWKDIVTGAFISLVGTPDEIKDRLNTLNKK